MTPDAAIDALIRRYEEGPAALRRAWQAVPPEARTWRPGPGQWSPHEVIVHTADSETTSAWRIRHLLSAPDAVIQGYDEVAWAEQFDYHAHDPELALATVDAVRANTAALLRRLPGAAWARVGAHSDSGPYRATDWLAIYAAHCHDHAAQVLAAVEAHRRGVR